MNILFTAKISEQYQERFKTLFPQHTFRFFSSINEAVDEIEEAEVFVTYGEDLTERNFGLFKKLKWIQVLTAGVDKFPLDLLAKSPVILTNVRGIHKIPMAEYSFAAMLQYARSFSESYIKQREGKWDARMRVDELYGKTLGIIGVGAIGEEIALRARVFGMKVLGVTRSGKENPLCDEMYSTGHLHDFLPQCDYIVIVVPSTPDTYQMISEKEFSLMKANAVFINIARGSVVNEEALLSHLNEGKIKGAVLDVFAEEPLPEDSPFWKAKNCIITPHISGRSPHYMERALEIFQDNLTMFGAGNLDAVKNIIDYTKGY